MRNLCLLLVKLFSTDLVSKNHAVILDEEKPWPKLGFWKSLLISQACRPQWVRSV
jgi:hypothetical protein